MMNISIEYDRLYEEFSKLFKKYNPCQVGEDKSICGKDRTMCCLFCRHLGKSGCRVKALHCKSWLCREMISSDQTPYEFRKKRRQLIKQAEKLGLFYFRCSKREVLRRRKVLKAAGRDTKTPEHLVRSSHWYEPRMIQE